MKTFLVNSRNFFNYGVTTICLAAFAVYELTKGEYTGAAVFCFAAIVDLIATIRHGSIIRSGEDEISIQPIFFQKVILRWSDIREVGVLNTDEFGEHKMLSRGAEYFYLSDHVMNEEQRIEMGNHWPPKDMVYLKKTNKSEEEIKSHFRGRIVTISHPADGRKVQPQQQ